MGSDREVSSDFQLIAGTNRDLRVDVAHGRFREDLFARINLWSYTLPGLAQRPEDIEPNVEHQLSRVVAQTGRVVRFNAEAKTRYLQFAKSANALWSGNFRDLSASVTRMATLADGGRISTDLVDAEIQRLQWLWQPVAAVNPARLALEAMLPADTIDSLDLFDRMQLEAVIRVCQESPTLSDAGRRLFDRSRTQRSIVNDADRLRKYLLKFQLTWHSVRSMALAHESR
jgi:transcriptional regulatory protein RtcR